MSEISSANVVVPDAPNGGPLLRTEGARRAKRAARNLAIFKKAEIEQLSHEEIAHRYGLKRSRVSQIVRRIRRELADAAPDDPQIDNHLAQQRLQKALEKLRLEYALD